MDISIKLYESFLSDFFNIENVINSMYYLVIILIFIGFILFLYTILIYGVLIKIMFFRGLLKDCGLPIPIEDKKTNKTNK